jgi:hypothetical protein
VIRIGGPDRVDDRFLGPPVHLGHQIVEALVADRQHIQVACGLVDDAPGAPRGLDRDVDHGVVQRHLVVDPVL